MRKNKKGFTIIELLIVMSIILVLMGLIVPKFKGYQAKANKVKVENYAKQIYTAVMASYGEENGSLVQEKVQSSINELVGIVESDNNKIGVSVDGDAANITFQVDKKSYSMIVNDEGYDLKESKK